ncbi:uncharacterized protein CELE_R10E4.3 [Caenorhabditis elegans]|uniref:Uncharacterized protein n=1 Tax=Caenorhabditis elegans TaxID=6239 RepID=Q21901_CAEEL|nr:Uncharacterized protein CELE_R10E4.3 [Caenorhabditis elegans]CAA90764.1 Uncharacterized protein CELE_R10E4.3 [Caenorhabditis elegans]|eukprot:NP_497857.1 Uncharacterized protein CELE_R10E4.3 [Caenorhabditis elegans]
MTSASSQEEDGSEEDEHFKSILLIIMFGAQFVCFLIAWFWFYPRDEPPNNQIMHKLEKDTAKSRIAGGTVRPISRLTSREIRFLAHHDTCHERGFELTEDDKKLLKLAKEGEINHLKHVSKLFDDLTMNCGSIIVKRGASIETNFNNETMEQFDNDETAGIEYLVPLKRSKEEKEKKKKRKTKERMDALDELTRVTSNDRIPLLSRIVHHNQPSRKTLKPATSTIRERTLETQSTMEDDKTQLKVIRKPSSRPHKKPSTMESAVKKKKSAATLKTVRKTTRDELSLATTLEETTRSKKNPLSKEP